jgi:NAD(P)-dependent dehydrogenase (short-subunit alcohol dehydrogenase family)
MFDFTAKTALVTGPTGGLGRALSARFAQAGANTGSRYWCRARNAVLGRAVRRARAIASSPHGGRGATNASR